jgi:hypothetical protein
MKTFMLRRIRSFGIGLVAVAGFSLAAPSAAHAQVRFGVSISVGTPPPPLLVYDQPEVPGPDYLWTPGYWAWGDAGYYWVPGAWVLAPQPGLLWTPGYWDCAGGVYGWHPGYWGRRVGFYGGINYGFGYFGVGFVGGGWSGGHFRYNTAVTRVNTRIVHNVYVDRRVIVNNRTVTRVSYHGGAGGVAARAPLAVRGGRVPRVPMTSMQREHEMVSGQDRNQFAGVTHQHPRQVAVAHTFSTRNRPSTFEQVRPADRVAPAARGPRQAPAHGGSAGHPQGQGHRDR